MSDVHLEKAAKMIGVKPIFEFAGHEIHVVCVIPWSPPLIAEWWRGKAASIIAVDVNGNFFLLHCDGSVRYWEHSKRSDVVVAKSVEEFARRLREDHNDTLSWWKKTMMDPLPNKVPCVSFWPEPR
jgi:hypothetical protein